MDELNQESAKAQQEDNLTEESDVISYEDTSHPALEQLEHERDDYKDRMQRAQAELINFKRRTADERIQTTKKEKSRIISNLLGVIDDLELAMQQQGKLAGDPTWAAGIELVYRKLEAALINEELNTIEVSPGDIFDPLLHEGLAYQAHPEYEEGQIVDVLRKGYLLDGKLLRAAQVSVAHKPQQFTESNMEGKE